MVVHVVPLTAVQNEDWLVQFALISLRDSPLGLVTAVWLNRLVTVRPAFLGPLS